MGVLVLLLACAPLPDTAGDLYGIWSRVDADEAVVFEFWEERDYALYNYPLDEGPAVLSTGEYALQDGRLVLVADNGETLAYALLSWTEGEELELQVSTTPQTYTFAEVLP